MLGTGINGGKKMFDKLIESEPEGADFKNRRNYFMVSSAVVGIIFAAAVVISIYAADFSLGTSRFELVELIAPDSLSKPEPEPRPQPRNSQPQPAKQAQVAMRPELVARVDETPKDVPTAISTVKNPVKERAEGITEVGPLTTDPVGDPSSTRGTGTQPTAGTGLTASGPKDTEKEPDPEPPPVKKPEPPVVKTIVSGGVVNGKATSLPKPSYSAAAQAVGAQGKVTVQVLIDESGRVISANAVSGHVLLQPSAIAAARNARFSVTYLSGVPVKVTGMIVYNFTK